MGEITVTPDCVNGWPMQMLLDSVRGNPDVLPSKVSLPSEELDPHLIVPRDHWSPQS